MVVVVDLFVATIPNHSDQAVGGGEVVWNHFLHPGSALSAMLK